MLEDTKGLGAYTLPRVLKRRYFGVSGVYSRRSGSFTLPPLDPRFEARLKNDRTSGFC